MIKIAVVMEPCEEGGFAVHVPNLPGCFSEGETFEEAVNNIREAIALHLAPAEDDLIVEDDAKILELTLDWHADEPSSGISRDEPGSGSPASPSTSGDVGPSQPSSATRPRPRSRRIELGEGIETQNG